MLRGLLDRLFFLLLIHTLHLLDWLGRGRALSRGGCGSGLSHVCALCRDCHPRLRRA